MNSKSLRSRRDEQEELKVMRWGIAGFGEVGSLFARELSRFAPGAVCVCDPLLNRAPAPEHLARRLDGLEVEIAPDLATLAQDADIVLSLVTAGAATDVARAAAGAAPGVLFVDFN